MWTDNYLEWMQVTLDAHHVPGENTNAYYGLFESFSMQG